MNKLIAVLFASLFMLIIPTICSAQPYVVSECRVQRCYAVLLPIPHSRCECLDYYYYPVYTPRHYRPAPPPPRGPRPGHHPPPPPHNHHNHRPGPGPRR